MVGDGSGQTVAIVDAYDDPAFVTSTHPSSDPAFQNSDLGKFDAYFGLSDPPSFTKLNETGGTVYPGTQTAGTNNWEGEEALDVEWVHAVAPQAGIILIEASSASSSDLDAAVDTARNIAGVSVVSMSFGSGETSSDPSSNALFMAHVGHAGITFVASTGDSGSPGEYPADSPNVVAVGGTSLTLSGSTYSGETGWSGSGGGQSLYETEPSYQTSVQSSGKREIPDVSFVADPNTGVAVYDSYNGGAAPWYQFGGTSVAAPCWAGLIAIADQLRVSQGGTPLDGRAETLPSLYACPRPISTTSPAAATAVSRPARVTTWLRAVAARWPTSSCPTWRPTATRRKPRSMRPRSIPVLGG